MKKYVKNTIYENNIVCLGNVLLTSKQVSNLKQVYGEILFDFAIMLLNDKIKCNRQNKKLHNASNHYSYFRRDGKLINFALEVMNSAVKCGDILY